MHTSRTIIGLLIITIGILLFGAQYSWWFFSFARWWPLFLFIPGVAMYISSGRSTGRREAGLLIPATILTIYGLYFFVEVWTNWQTTGSTSFVFTLAIALAFYLAAQADPGRRRGYMIVTWIFLISAAINLLATLGQSKLWPFILIIIGLLILFRPGFRRSSPTTNTSDRPGPSIDSKTVNEETIELGYPSSANPEFAIEFAAGTLRLEPGDGEHLVRGLARYSAPEWKPSVRTEGDRVRLRVGNDQVWTTMTGWWNRWGGATNDWKLRIGTKPMRLHLKLGALKGSIDLGGLALISLKVDTGASDTRLDFASVNTVPMERFDLNAGAAKFHAAQLAQTNAAIMNFTGGAGETQLDFSGHLQRDMNVHIGAGVGKVTVVVPRVTRCTVVKSGVASVRTEGDWVVNGSEYRTAASAGPVITIKAELGIGSLELRVV